MGHRELFFECSMVAGHRRRSALIRAWDAAEAAAIFKEQLSEEGLAPHGIVDVVAWTAQRGAHQRPARSSVP